MGILPTASLPRFMLLYGLLTAALPAWGHESNDHLRPVVSIEQLTPYSVVINFRMDNRNQRTDITGWEVGANRRSNRRDNRSCHPDFLSLAAREGSCIVTGLKPETEYRAQARFRASDGHSHGGCSFDCAHEGGMRFTTPPKALDEHLTNLTCWTRAGCNRRNETCEWVLRHGNAAEAILQPGGSCAATTTIRQGTLYRDDERYGWTLRHSIGLQQCHKETTCETMRDGLAAAGCRSDSLGNLTQFADTLNNIMGWSADARMSADNGRLRCGVSTPVTPPQPEEPEEPEPPSGELAAKVAALETRMAALEASMTAQRTTLEASIEAQRAALEGRIDELQATLDDSEATSEEKAADLEERLTALEAAIEDIGPSRVLYIPVPQNEGD